MTIPTQQADGAEEVAKLLADVREGDRLTLVYETPDGTEEDVDAEAATDAAPTDGSEKDSVGSNVAFWYRNLDRGEGDSLPFATVQFRPVYSGIGPTVRVHGYTPTPEATAAMKYLGEVARAAIGMEGNSI